MEETSFCRKDMIKFMYGKGDCSCFVVVEGAAYVDVKMTQDVMNKAGVGNESPNQMFAPDKDELNWWAITFLFVGQVPQGTVHNSMHF